MIKQLSVLRLVLRRRGAFIIKSMNQGINSNSSYQQIASTIIMKFSAKSSPFLASGLILLAALIVSGFKFNDQSDPVPISTPVSECDNCKDIPIRRAVTCCVSQSQCWYVLTDPSIDHFPG